MNYEAYLKHMDSYKQIDEGGYRTVLDIGDGLVLKVAIDDNVDIEQSKEVNRSEYQFYQQAEDKGYLCPALWVSEDGMYLIMKNAHRLPKPITDQTLDTFIEKMLIHGREEYEVNSPANWVGDYLVDYGIIKTTMKTEMEIRKEILAIKKDDETFRKQYKEGEIPKEVFKSKMRQNSSMRLALKWVLGENERYD